MMSSRWIAIVACLCLLLECSMSMCLQLLRTEFIFQVTTPKHLISKQMHSSAAFIPPSNHTHTQINSLT
jgi:hypothetical protein